jgi:hypothetical protein
MQDALQEMFDGFAHHAPAVLGALLLLLIGWLIARLARMLAVRLLHVMEAVIERATGRAASPGLRGSANVFGTLIFWIVLMFFITAATQSSISWNALR